MMDEIELKENGKKLPFLGENDTFLPKRQSYIFYSDIPLSNRFIFFQLYVKKPGNLQGARAS